MLSSSSSPPRCQSPTAGEDGPAAAFLEAAGLPANLSGSGRSGVGRGPDSRRRAAGSRPSGPWGGDAGAVFFVCFHRSTEKMCTRKEAKIWLQRHTVLLCCPALDRYISLRAAPVCGSTGQFIQVEQNFDSIPAVLNSMGGTQTVNKISKRTSFSLPRLLLLIAFTCATHFFIRLCSNQKHSSFFFSDSKVRQSQCALFAFVVRRFDYLQHWSWPYKV